MTVAVTKPSVDLTPEQRRIVEFGDGPLVVIAGAGTGKTRVIIERVRWLLETKGSGTLDSRGRQLADEPTATDRDDDDRRDDPRADDDRRADD